MNVYVINPSAYFIFKDDNSIHCESLILPNYMRKYASAEDMAGM